MKSGRSSKSPDLSSERTSCMTWDQAPHWGKKEKKKIGVGEKKKASREVGPSLGSLARRYFSYWTLLFTLFRRSGAWPQANPTLLFSQLRFSNLEKKTALTFLSYFLYFRYFTSFNNNHICSFVFLYDCRFKRHYKSIKLH